MDGATKQWIVDRVIWIVALAAGALVAANAFAAEHRQFSGAGAAPAAFAAASAIPDEKPGEAR